MQKWASLNLRQIFLQRIYTNGQRLHEKMLNTTSYKENSNQNYNKIPFHTHENDYYQKQNITSIGLGCKETETPLHCWWKSKMVQILWKTVWQFLKKLQLPHHSAIPLLGI